MRWNSLVSMSQDGVQGTETTVHLTECEAAMIVRGLECYLQLMEQAFQADNEELRALHGFNPAHYASVVCMVELMENASGMSREQLGQVEWWKTFEQMDPRDWVDFAPRCDFPITHPENISNACPLVVSGTN